jgi:hypothetical protein
VWCFNTCIQCALSKSGLLSFPAIHHLPLSSSFLDFHEIHNKIMITSVPHHSIDSLSVLIIIQLPLIPPLSHLYQILWINILHSNGLRWVSTLVENTISVLCLAYFTYPNVQVIMFLEVSGFHSLWLNNIPLCISATFSFSIYSLMGVQVGSLYWLLWLWLQ